MLPVKSRGQDSVNGSGDNSNDNPTSLTILRETVSATLTNASTLADRVTQLARPLLTPDQAALLDLGLTEVLTNIVRHGYNGTAGSIAVTVTRTKPQLAIEIVDQGQRIPPNVLAQDADAAFRFDPQDLDAIPEGGMGIGLIKKSFDSLRYEVGEQENTMYLTLELPPADKPV